MVWVQLAPVSNQSRWELDGCPLGGGRGADATRGGDTRSSGWRLLLPREERLISDSDAARRCLGLRPSSTPMSRRLPAAQTGETSGIYRSAVFTPALLALLASLLAVALAPLAVISLYKRKGESR